MRIILLIFLVVGLSSCKNKKDEVTNNLEKNEDFGEGVGFPIYNFEGLKPLLHKEDDKTYIINFWATWCKPCIAELPDFEKVYLEQKENNVELILVSLDMPNMWKKRLVPFVEEHKLKGRVVILDDTKMNDWMPQVNENWGGGIPATLIYNKDKRLFFEEGLSYNRLTEVLNEFIKTR
ncbi:TlpA family protein disulfide reductase [Croceivirga sp. JEA036]|uniref:TlpA family protein disulfide reductase n=1 Tax=Croceivirga sp. JEA036 TaxID=2721162 RepID=UPI00143BEBB4|nr:TlpA disulfide reductase family protein [Croceivirga sp. JEA036]NJB35937.1 TlpA family protein disulfide reductase [Croceivirga sp. JEA036]